jgi:predicted DsbA family dithiol-disulfide isomerase
VSLANRMAVASPKVNARTIEASEFPDLSRRFGVQGVPRTVVNEEGAFVGAMPEPQFVAAVLELAGVPADGAAGADGDDEGRDQEEGDTEP